MSTLTPPLTQQRLEELLTATGLTLTHHNGAIVANIAGRYLAYFTADPETGTLDIICESLTGISSAERIPLAENNNHITIGPHMPTLYFNTDPDGSLAPAARTVQTWPHGVSRRQLLAAIRDTLEGFQAVLNAYAQGA